MDLFRRLALRAWTGADVALGGAMATAIAFNALLTARTDRGWPFGVGVGVAICASALLRRRNRARAVVAGLILLALTGYAVVRGVIPQEPLFGGGLAGLLVLGAAAARKLPLRTAAVIGAAGTLVIAASESAGPDGLYDRRVLWVLAGAMGWSLALAVGLYLRYLDFLHGQELETARREERLGLARELHDVVAHHVTGMVVQAQAARFAGHDDPGTLLSALDNIETAGIRTLAAARQLVGLLRDPGDNAAESQPEPISDLVQRFAEQGPPVDLRLLGGAPASGWPPEVTSTVYRVVQESLTNVIRHAPGARSVVVTVNHDPGHVRVEVTDDAPATRLHRPGDGFGLVGMRERVEALGGRLRAGPMPGAGWVVQASLPVPAESRP
jgi:signal transduction histidine kinase